MPRIIRWFPVTHEINADPELWELRETHGDRGGFVWLECLSIADRNDGVVGPASDQTRNQLASKCRTSRVKVGLVLDWCRVKGWLVFGEHIQVANYKKYHRTEERKKLPSYPNLPNLPDLSEPKKDPAEASGVSSKEEKPDRKPDPVVPFESTKFTERAKKICGRNPEHLEELIQWIISMKTSMKSEPMERVNAVVRLSLDAIERHIENHRPIHSLWGLLTTIFDSERARYMQGPENESHKSGAIPAEIQNLSRGIG